MTTRAPHRRLAIGLTVLHLCALLGTLGCGQQQRDAHALLDHLREDGFAVELAPTHEWASERRYSQAPTLFANVQGLRVRILEKSSPDAAADYVRDRDPQIRQPLHASVGAGWGMRFADTTPVPPPPGYCNGNVVLELVAFSGLSKAGSPQRLARQVVESFQRW